MPDVTLTPDSIVSFHDLHFSDTEDGEVELGRPDTGVFFRLEPAPADLLRWLVAGKPIESVAAAFHTEPDVVIDFVRELGGCQFVRAVDGVDLLEDEPERPPLKGWHLFANLPQRRGRMAGQPSGPSGLRGCVGLARGPVRARAQRYAPYLAGMTADASLLLISAQAALGWTSPVTSALSYLLLMGLIFEFRALSANRCLLRGHQRPSPWQPGR